MANRFTDVIMEKEGILNRCKKCNMALVKVDLPWEGLGSVARSLPYMFCEPCDIYYINYSEEEYEDGDT